MTTDQLDFAEFFRRRRDGCLRAVLAAVGDRHRAEDLVAEAFARAWADWGRISRHPAPEAWIVRTCLNTHVSWWRRRRREVGWEPRVEPAAPEDTGPEVDPAVLAALRALPLRQREVVVLRVFLDLDTRATADALGIAPGTVRAHLHRAVETLRHRIAPESRTLLPEQEVVP